MEIEVSGQQYDIGRLDTFKQLKVFKRLVPILAAMVFGREDGEAADLKQVVSNVAEALSKLPDDDLDFVTTTCLAAVKRRQGDKFAAVLARSGVLMFDDIDLATMIELTTEVVKENLGPFFEKLGDKLNPATTTG